MEEELGQEQYVQNMRDMTDLACEGGREGAREVIVYRDAPAKLKS